MPEGFELDDVVARLTRPGRALLLLLDLRPPPPDPRSLPSPPVDGMGAFDWDALVRGRDDLALLVSTAGDQVPIGSPAPGRSAFGYYVEQGLRGAADRSGDGRLMVGELAGYVEERVARWSGHSGGGLRSPRSYGADFAVRGAPKVLPAPTPLPKEAPAYPTWLAEAWKRRDADLRAGAAREAPRPFGQVEAAILRAEGDWMGGADEGTARDVLRDRLARRRPAGRRGPCSEATGAAIARPRAGRRRGRRPGVGPGDPRIAIEAAPPGGRRPPRPGRGRRRRRDRRLPREAADRVGLRAGCRGDAGRRRRPRAVPRRDCVPRPPPRRTPAPADLRRGRGAPAPRPDAAGTLAGDPRPAGARAGGAGRGGPGVDSGPRGAGGGGAARRRESAPARGRGPARAGGLRRPGRGRPRPPVGFEHDRGRPGAARPRRGRPPPPGRRGPTAPGRGPPPGGRRAPRSGLAGGRGPGPGTRRRRRRREPRRGVREPDPGAPPGPRAVRGAGHRRARRAADRPGGEARRARRPRNGRPPGDPLARGRPARRPLEGRGHPPPAARGGGPPARRGRRPRPPTGRRRRPADRRPGPLDARPDRANLGRAARPGRPGEREGPDLGEPRRRARGRERCGPRPAGPDRPPLGVRRPTRPGAGRPDPGAAGCRVRGAPAVAPCSLRVRGDRPLALGVLRIRRPGLLGPGRPEPPCPGRRRGPGLAPPRPRPPGGSPDAPASSRRRAGRRGVEPGGAAGRRPGHGGRRDLARHPAGVPPVGPGTGPDPPAAGDGLADPRRARPRRAVPGGPAPARVRPRPPHKPRPPRPPRPAPVAGPDLP